MNRYVIGIDFGTDSVRALLVECETGIEICNASAFYPRWKQGLYCDPQKQQFRQHPLDYTEALEIALVTLLKKAPEGCADHVAGIGIDTTGSTIIAIDEHCTALSLLPQFSDEPDAMFILWKDHTAVAEAEEITKIAQSNSIEDYTRFVGGTYSSEWFWAKILHTLRCNKTIRDRAYSWVEHCDWIASELGSIKDLNAIKRSRCAAGHKALWHESWNGLPPNDFLKSIDPLLDGIRERLFTESYTSDTVAATLSSDWAKKTGLPEGIPIAVGLFDCHAGAVGANVEPGVLIKVFGTSTCDITVADPQTIGSAAIKSICGQVDGSVLPGVVGLEAGQSAFGDLYKWYKELLIAPVIRIITESENLREEQKESLRDELERNILKELEKAAVCYPIEENGTVALDWINGRRTPDANQRLTMALTGLTIGTDSFRVYRSLVEATAFGARKIVECFKEQGIPIHKIVGIGGIAKKSPFVMQICADVLDCPIEIIDSEESCARGAAIFAAVASGIFNNVSEAQIAMKPRITNAYYPQPKNVLLYNTLYKNYLDLGKYVEEQL